MKSQREFIREVGEFPEGNRELLIEFDEQMALRPSDFAHATRYKALQYTCMMAGDSPGLDSSELPDVQLSRVLEEREAAEEIVRWIHDRYDNAESNAGFRRVLRTFGRVITDGDETPDSLSWIPTQLPSTHDATPEPSNMISWDEVLEMVDNTFNARDAALLAVGWDAGFRGGEMLELTLGDVTDHKHGLRITAQGKMGQRTVTLIPSVPYLQRWLDDHPASGDPEAPLWSKLSESDDVTAETLWKAIRRAAERAGVADRKTVNFTMLRKSSASYLASQGMSQAHLENHHGWKRGSDVASRYVAVFGDAADNELARIHGKDVSADEPDPVGPIECTRCGKETPREKDFCIHCQQSLDLEAEELLDRVTDHLDERAIDEPDPGIRKDVIEGRRTLEEKPGAVDTEELHKLLSSSED